MARRSDGHLTQAHILEAAAELFALHGYANTKVSDICAEAEANSAAVNYHFGSKEELYREVWRREIRIQEESNPPMTEAICAMEAKSQLHFRVSALVHQFFHIDGKATRFGLLLTREMADPTGLIDDLRKAYFGPIYEANRSVVRALLGPNVGERELLFAQTSMVHQCIALGMRRGFQQSRGSGIDAPNNKPMNMLLGYMQHENGVRELIDHITRFTLAGIEATRKAATELSLKGPAA